METNLCLVFVICYIMINNVVGQDCDFDNNTICNWVQSNQDDGNWNVGFTISQFTGPPNGHTSTSSNNYCYLEAKDFKDDLNKVIENKRVVLVSPDLNGGDTACFRFFYYMYGTAVNTLSVGVVSVNTSLYVDDTSRRELFNKKGEQGQKWICGQIKFRFSNSERIYIEAKTGITDNSNVAVDDLSFEKGTGCALPCDITQLSTTTDDTITSSTDIDNSTQVFGLNTVSIDPLTTTPKVDIDTNILFYLISIPVVLFVTVTIIAIVCYCKRSKSDSSSSFFNPNPTTIENPQYEGADVYDEAEVYDEITEYDAPNDTDSQADYNASYIEPISGGYNSGPYDRLRTRPDTANNVNVGFSRPFEPSVGLYNRPGHNHATYNNSGFESTESDYMGLRDRIPNEQAPDRPTLPPRQSRALNEASMPPSQCYGPQSRTNYIQPF